MFDSQKLLKKEKENVKKNIFLMIGCTMESMKEN